MFGHGQYDDFSFTTNDSNTETHADTDAEISPKRVSAIAFKEPCNTFPSSHEMDSRHELMASRIHHRNFFVNSSSTRILGRFNRILSILVPTKALEAKLSLFSLSFFK